MFNFRNGVKKKERGGGGNRNLNIFGRLKKSVDNTF